MSENLNGKFLKWFLDRIIREYEFLLNTREIQILEFRFGLKGEKPMTYKQISSYFKVSIARARQLEYKALDKILSRIQLAKISHQENLEFIKNQMRKTK